MNCLFLGTVDDVEYVPFLKSMFHGRNTYIYTGVVEYLTMLEAYCAKRNITSVVSTNTAILKKLLEAQGNIRSNPSLNDYQGSLFTFGKEAPIEIVFISPLRQLFTVPYGNFLARRFISKVANPTDWAEASVFRYALATPTNLEQKYNEFTKSVAIACDIETFRNPLSIRCIGYTAVYVSSTGAISSDTIVLPLDSLFSLAWMRKFNELPNAKIFQRGKYDNSYLLRYNAHPRNWLWDTANMFHSWYSELPKDLAFLNAFFLRKVVYWKDLSETGELSEYYRYCGLDTWATANVWIQWLRTAPGWAKRNYALEFPLNFPCLLAEMTGLKRDTQRLIEQRRVIDEGTEKEVSSLRSILKLPGFNTNSPVQVKAVLKLLGCNDITSTEEKDLKKAAYRHPLNGLIIEKILKVRGLRKLSSTYLRIDSDHDGTKNGNGAKEFFGRVLYSLNPDGTDSGRLASREHNFWCGLQIQNIPVGPEVKSTICAEDGFYLGEADLEQAESRDTAYISGDEGYITAVTGTRDFHSVNASAFFGIPYADLYDDAIRKTKNKTIRDLSKRTNHGANYNMGPDVMVDTMGLANIWKAKKLLGLKFNKPREIAAYLLERFHETYPGIKGTSTGAYAAGTYYSSVVKEITTSSMLVSRAFHHTPYNLSKGRSPEEYIQDGDWTRYCFGNPDKNKPALNAYVAHAPQSLNARTLNEAWLAVFYEVALPNPQEFRLHAQIHDSILFSYRIGFQHLATRVGDLLQIPVTIRNVKGKYSTFTVPSALKLGKKDSTGECREARYWNETE